MQAQIETSLCNKNVLTMRWTFSDMKRDFWEVCILNQTTVINVQLQEFEATQSNLYRLKLH